MATETGTVAEIQRKRNIKQVLAGVGFGLLAGLMWFISFGVITWLFLVPCSLFGYRPPAVVRGLVVWGCMGLLAFEGVRYGRELFDTGTVPDTALSRNALSGRFVGCAWLVSQTLFAAPRCTVRAVDAFRSLVFLGQEERAAANQILADLAQSSEWRPAGRYDGREAGLTALNRLGLLRMRHTGRGVEVKLPPDVRKKLHGPPPT
ncbi:MAG: hypothetical protein R6X33_00420 [Candidatus Brocadiia bacterium]